jgi:succinate dehydrogenase / fumarate reductase cytochrome b subunit
LQVYRLPFVALLSILHRITGVALVAGSLLLAYWLGAAAFGPEHFARANACLGSPIGLILLFGWSAALYYHLCNGVRHLLWDIGWGYELGQAKASGYVVLAATAALTAVSWIVGLGLGS